jgi:predicted ArsR family transcriptional regulator
VRTVEGYMAEVLPERAEAVAAGGDDDADADGEPGFLLIEHHCPICEAAESCQGLCRGELELFRTVLGDDVSVERVQHLMAGDLRCTYRVRPTRRRQPSRRRPLEVSPA